MKYSYQETFEEIRASECLRARISQIPQQQAQAVPRPRRLPRAALLAAALVLAAGTVAAAGGAMVHLRAGQEGRYEIPGPGDSLQEDFSQEAREARQRERPSRPSIPGEKGLPSWGWPWKIPWRRRWSRQLFSRSIRRSWRPTAC